MIAYNYDANCILAETLKNRQGQSITTAWTKIHKKNSIVGVALHTYVLDNEISSEFEAALNKENTKYQLMPPHYHRANLAERAIQTFKN